MTQIIRGQAVSTAISGAGAGQGAASPTAAGQTPPGTPRAQGQGQVKLTLAQLGQLTQVSHRRTPHYRLSCDVIPCITCLLLSTAHRRSSRRDPALTGRPVSPVLSRL